MSKTYIIGDLHGCLRGLEEVLHLAPVNIGKDHLIFLGDLVDGWSDSLLLLEYLFDLNQKTPCTFLRGNHDDWCHQYLRTGVYSIDWMNNGGRTTISLYDEPQDKQKHLAVMDLMQDYYVDADNNLYVHAGFEHPDGPAHDSTFTLMWSRKLVKALFEKKQAPDSIHELARYNHIFVGHTPTIHLQSTVPLTKGNFTIVDTGAGFYGPLTIMESKTLQYWQSKPAWELYPTERGRMKESFEESAKI